MPFPGVLGSLSRRRGDWGTGVADISLMTDSVLFIMGSLMLAVAVVKQKLGKRIAWLIVRFTGTKTSRSCFGISVVSGLLASFIGEHTVAAMMLPVGMILISLTSDDPRKVRNLAAILLFTFRPEYYGLIVVSDSGKSRLKRFLVGSVAFGVMGRSETSVLNVR